MCGIMTIRFRGRCSFSVDLSFYIEAFEACGVERETLVLVLCFGMFVRRELTEMAKGYDMPDTTVYSFDRSPLGTGPVTYTHTHTAFARWQVTAGGSEEDA